MKYIKIYRNFYKNMVNILEMKYKVILIILLLQNQIKFKRLLGKLKY